MQSFQNKNTLQNWVYLAKILFWKRKWQEISNTIKTLCFDIFVRNLITFAP